MSFYVLCGWILKYLKTDLYIEKDYIFFTFRKTDMFSEVNEPLEKHEKFTYILIAL